MKNILLVAGFDYAFKGVNFRHFADNRMKRLLAANRAKDDMTFTIFDCATAEVITNAVTYPGGVKTASVTKLTPSPFVKPKKSDFDYVIKDGEKHYFLKDGRRDLLSILDVYDEVQRIGTAAAGTLTELSIFSHAWMGGPILYNSMDDGQFETVVPGGGPVMVPIAPGTRDPDDFDPRIKDFRAPIMDATALTKFQSAFHADALIWIWGCAFPRLVHEILHKIERNAAYKDSGLADTVNFHVTNFRAPHVALLASALRPELGATPFPDPRNINILFKHLKLFFCRITTASYTHHLAVNANVKTFGGVMGTYSEYDSGPLPLMHVHTGFARHFTFYKNYLGFTFDPDSRHYGLYKPTFACTP